MYQRSRKGGWCNSESTRLPTWWPGLIPRLCTIIINNNYSNNQRLGSAFDDLNPRLSLLCHVVCPCKKICGGRQMCVPRSIHPRQRCPTQSRLESALGVRSSYVERNNNNGILVESTVSRSNWNLEMLA